MAGKTPRRKPQRQGGGIGLDEIRDLQLLVARSVLAGERLPGGADRVQFPDAAFFAGHDIVMVADENLAGGRAARRSARAVPPLQIASEEQVAARAREAGDVPYLAFSAPSIEGSTVTITVHGRIAPQDSARGAGHLSSATFRFERRGDAWELVEGPTYSAA